MRKTKQIFSMILCLALLLAQVSYVYAAEDEQLATADSPQAEAAEDTQAAVGDYAQEDDAAASGDSEASEENSESAEDASADVEETAAVSDEAELEVAAEGDAEAASEVAAADADAVIIPSMTKEEIDAAIEGASEVTVQAGDYSDKDLFVSGKNVRILEGDNATSFRFMKVSKGKLILENDLTVNPDGVIVATDKSAMNLTDATVEGNNKNLKVYCKNTKDNMANAYCMSAMGDKVVLNNLKLTINESSNGDRGLLNINSTSFEAHDSNLQVCNNAGLNIWGSAGAPNICVGRDAVCATREINFTNCTVNASGSVHAYGDGFQINKTTDPCTITFDTCKVNFDYNGGNGFMGQTSTGDMTKKVVVINSDVSACKNGGGNGASIGFANAAITLKNTDKEAGGYTFEVSDNYRLGIAANGLGAYTSINAEGYRIVVNRNGVNSPDRVFGYGMYLARGGSSFENCKLIAEGNQKDGITLGGDAKVTLKDTEVRTVMNGSNGLVLNAETEFSNSTLLSACNGAIKGDEVDTTATSSFAFSDGTSGSIGRTELNGNGTADDSSRVVALFDGESTAVTKGDKIYLLADDGTVDEEATEGDICHHAIDWENDTNIIAEPTDAEYGKIEGICGVCGNDKQYKPLVRVVYDKNTEDKVTDMPETITNQIYGSDIPVSGSPVRSGYKFTGWYLSADTENTEVFDGVLEVKQPTVTLYAGWEKDEETVVPDPTDDPDTPTPTPTDDPDTPPTGGPGTTPNNPPVVPRVVPIPVGNPLPAPVVNPVPDNNPVPQAIQNLDEDVPLANNDLGASWALVNFALMNLAVFESIMLLIGYFIKTKDSEEEEEEENEGKKLKKRGIIRLISIPIAIISVIAFILTEDITNPTAFVDKYTLLMALIALVQTVAVGFSRKKYEYDEDEEAEDVQA